MQFGTPDGNTNICGKSCESIKEQRVVSIAGSALANPQRHLSGRFLTAVMCRRRSASFWSASTPSRKRVSSSAVNLLPETWDCTKVSRPDAMLELSCFEPPRTQVIRMTLKA
jgi:hypothetical protein